MAVFSLSLWGTNYTDYLNEAYRVLRRKGFIYIAEPSKHYETLEEQNNLKQINFSLTSILPTILKFYFLFIVSNKLFNVSMIVSPTP